MLLNWNILWREMSWVQIFKEKYNLREWTHVWSSDRLDKKGKGMDKGKVSITGNIPVSLLVSDWPEGFCICILFGTLNHQVNMQLLKNCFSWDMWGPDSDRTGSKHLPQRYHHCRRYGFAGVWLPDRAALQQDPVLCLWQKFRHLSAARRCPTLSR